MTYTAADAQKEYPPLIKRWQVREMGNKFGLKRWTIRQLTEGKDAALKPRKFAGQKLGSFQRDKAIEVFASNG
mgnify:CR=1 FL=1